MEEKKEKKKKKRANNNRIKIFHRCPRLTGVTLTQRLDGKLPWQSISGLFLQP